MHPFPTHLLGNHRSVLCDCGDSLHITDICTDDPVEDSSPSPSLPPLQFGSIPLWVVMLQTIFMFSLVCSILLCLPEVFSLFLEDLGQKWPLSDALTHTSSHWRIHSFHPHPRALHEYDPPRSFRITVLAWSLCLPEGSVVAVCIC